MSFRSQLVAQEQELLELRETNKELKHQLKSKDKVHKEVAGLKSIISSQDDKVPVKLVYDILEFIIEH